MTHLPRLARISVTARAGGPFKANVTQDGEEALVSLEAGSEEEKRDLCAKLERHGAQYVVLHDIDGAYASICLGFSKTSVGHAAQLIQRIFSEDPQELAITYWYFVDSDTPAPALLGARCEPTHETIAFILPQDEVRGGLEVWRQFHDRIDDEFDGVTSVTSNSEQVVIDLTPERYADLEATLLELVGLFTFNR